MALAQHSADYYKNNRRFIQKLWHHLLTHDTYEGTAASFRAAFQGS